MPRLCAQKYATDERVTVLSGVISKDAVMAREEVTQHPLFSLIEGHYDQHYAREVNDYKSADQVANELPEQADMLLLDGGEFSTAGDWSVLKDRGAAWVALDDVNVIKTSAIAKELQEAGWQRVFHTDDRNGSSVYWNPKA